MLNLTKSIAPHKYGNKEYVSQMHKQSNHLNAFNSIDEAKESLLEIKNTRYGFRLTRHDPLEAILKEKIIQKLQKTHNYVCSKNWLIGYGDKHFHADMVKQALENKSSTDNLIRDILDSFPQESKKVEKIYLFEFNTGVKSYTYEYKNI